MGNYKFNFKYESDAMKIKGDGTVKGETIERAMQSARRGVANDLNGSPSDVYIISIRKVK